MKQEITQEYLNALIITPKRITKKPEKEYNIINGSYRKNFELFSDKHKESFRAFIRYSADLPELFSIGLILQNDAFDNPPILYRCNGPHGGNIKYKEHFVPHIHSCTLCKSPYDEESLYSVEKTIQTTNLFTTLESALYHFCTHCNIIDAQRYFPNAYNTALF